MSATTPAAQPITASALASSPHDDGDLAEFGYEQQLHRSLGKFASFAAGFSFVSILTTIFQLFGLGFGFAGPAFFWTWPVVFIGQFMVALNFAELAADIRFRVPSTSGRGGWVVRSSLVRRLVHDSRSDRHCIGRRDRLAGRAPQCVERVPDHRRGQRTHLIECAANAVLLGSVLLVLTTFINCIGVNWMSRINNIGVTCEIVGVIAVIGMFFTHAQRGPDVVFDTGSAGGQPGYAWAWIMSGLMAAYVMVGFGSAGELAEETRNPRRVAPRTIRLALSASALGGGLMILGALMAAPSLTDGRLATEGLPYVLTSILSSPWGTVLLIDVSIAVFVCTLAIQTAASRLMFSMARDGRLPASQVLAKVNPRTGTPIAPSVLIGLVCIAVLAVNVGNSAIFATLSSVCIILIYLAYLMVTVPLLVQRLKGWPRTAVGPKFDAEGKKLFSLGIWGVPVNIAAVVYGALMVINLSWPRAEIFNPTGEYPILQWAAPITVALVVGLGVACFPRGRATPNPVTIGA